MEDRNGNLIGNTWQGTLTGGIYTFTDPLARTTTVNYTQDLNANTQDVITRPGYNGASSYTQFNPYVISSIVLADGTQYTMRYNAYAVLRHCGKRGDILRCQ